MENASKALLIAGGILFALITLALVTYMATSITRMTEAQDEKAAAEELVAFNKQYEAYHKSVMYGVDIISVYNKAEDSNGKNDFKINIIVCDKDGNTISISYGTEFKTKIFECISVTYNSNTGRISQMEFKEKN